MSCFLVAYCYYCFTKFCISLIIKRNAFLFVLLDMLKAAFVRLALHYTFILISIDFLMYGFDGVLDTFVLVLCLMLLCIFVGGGGYIFCCLNRSVYLFLIRGSAFVVIAFSELLLAKTKNSISCLFTIRCIYIHLYVYVFVCVYIMLYDTFWILLLSYLILYYHHQLIWFSGYC